MPDMLERPVATKRNDVTVKIDASVIHMAKVVAAHQEVSLAEYLSEVTRPIVERDYKEHSRRALGDEDKGEKPTKGKGGSK